MSVYRSKLSKDALLNMPEHERKLFLSITHLQDEIRFSLYGTIWSHDFGSSNDTVVQGQIAFTVR